MANAAISAGAVGGGSNNQALGTYFTVPGGYNNIAAENASVATGLSARAIHSGCFVFSDSSSINVTSCGAPYQFMARALGGVYFFTGGSSDATYTGAYLGPGTSAWAAYSDRDGKEDVAAVDPGDVLRKVAAMPVSTWRWTAEPGNVQHMGPMAQDFHAAFGLGNSDKRIVTIDADGVALATIQGLNAKLEATVAEQARENARLRAELADLRTLKEEVASIRAAQSCDSVPHR